MPDTHALLPIARLLAAGQTVIRRDHAALRAVHEDADTRALLQQTVVKRPDQIRAANPLAGADHFGMHGVIDQRRERLAVRTEALDDVAARIVEPFGVVVVSDLSL